MKCGVFRGCLAVAVATIVLSFLSAGKAHANAGTSGISHIADETLANVGMLARVSLAEPLLRLLFESLSGPAGLEGWGLWLSEQHPDEVPPEEFPFPTVGSVCP